MLMQALQVGGIEGGVAVGVTAVKQKLDKDKACEKIVNYIVLQSFSRANVALTAAPTPGGCRICSLRGQPSSISVR
jgi:hypothetical protein